MRRACTPLYRPHSNGLRAVIPSSDEVAPKMLRALSFAALLLATTVPATAQNSAPQPVPIVDTIPAARDVDYPGTMLLDVDATDTQRGIFRVKQTIPVAKSG